jgi:hypothetical protein
MVSEMKKEVDYYKSRAVAAGWAATQWSWRARRNPG